MFENAGASRYQQMRKSIAKKFFDKFPLAPVGALEFCLKNGTIPTLLDYNHLCEDILEPEKKKTKTKSDCVIFSIQFPSF